MTPQEIQERNKQIALMLGVDVNYSTQVYRDSKSNLRHIIDNMPKSEHLKFDIDWNWLMEAVEFITKLGGSYSISGKSCAISVDEPYWFDVEIIVYTNEPTHKAVFIAVSDFAKLYNEGVIIQPKQ
jgi:hypothetical protein